MPDETIYSPEMRATLRELDLEDAIMWQQEAAKTYADIQRLRAGLPLRISQSSKISDHMRLHRNRSALARSYLARANGTISHEIEIKYGEVVL